MISSFVYLVAYFLYMYTKRSHAFRTVLVKNIYVSQLLLDESNKNSAIVKLSISLYMYTRKPVVI